MKSIVLSPGSVGSLVTTPTKDWWIGFLEKWRSYIKEKKWMDRFTLPSLGDVLMRGESAQPPAVLGDNPEGFDLAMRGLFHLKDDKTLWGLDRKCTWVMADLSLGEGGQFSSGPILSISMRSATTADLLASFHPKDVWDSLHHDVRLWCERAEERANQARQILNEFDLDGHVLGSFGWNIRSE